MSTEYNDDFYDSFEKESHRSATVLVPLVIDLIKPSSVVDMGCGLGIWLSVFRENGAEEIMGFDGDYVDRNRLRIPQEAFIPSELATTQPLDRKFDLAVSLEVAEHLPPASSESFTRLLVSAAPVILFSAAIPGQPGTSHINPRWHNYWHGLFKGHGYQAFDPFRPVMWHDEQVSLHYRQNVFLYAHEDWLKEHPETAKAMPEVNCLTLIDEGVLEANLTLGATLSRIPSLLKKKILG